MIHKRLYFFYAIFLSRKKQIINGNSKVRLLKYSYSKCNKRMCNYDVLSSSLIGNIWLREKTICQMPKKLSKAHSYNQKLLNSYKCLHLRGIAKNILQKIVNSSTYSGYAIAEFKNGYLNATSLKQSYAFLQIILSHSRNIDFRCNTHRRSPCDRA